MSKGLVEVLEDIRFVPTKTVLLSQIRFDETNPNKLSGATLEALEKTITQYGFAVDPWLNDNEDGTYTVIDGEHRIKFLLKKKAKKVKAKIFNVSSVEIKMLRQIANKLRGEHDKKMDAQEFKNIFDEGKLDIFSEYSAIPMEELHYQLEKQFDMSFEKSEDSQVPEPPLTPKSKLGEIYQLGRHKIICGDSVMESTYQKLMDQDAKITLTSPPYNMGVNAQATDKNVKSKYANSDDNIEDYRKFLVDFTKFCLIHSTFTFVDIQQLANNKIDFIEYLYELRKNFVDRLIWDKEQAAPALAKNIFNSEFEDIIIFKNQQLPNRAITSGPGFHGRINNVYHGKPQKDNDEAKIHKATFPLHLPQFIIKNFTIPNDIVLDPFLGTGTTLIACEQTDRTCYGIELDPAYIDVIIKRWENFTGEKAVLL